MDAANSRAPSLPAPARRVKMGFPIFCRVKNTEYLLAAVFIFGIDGMASMHSVLLIMYRIVSRILCFPVPAERVHSAPSAPRVGVHVDDDPGWHIDRLPMACQTV